MSEHVVPKRVYYAIFGALIVLTAVTIQVAFVDLGLFNTVVALGIAGFKAMLVILYFMHARWSHRLVWVVIASGILFLAILVVITMSDYLSRGWML